MKILAWIAAAVVAAASVVVTSVPARANAFCPVTIAAVTNLAVLGRAGVYGVMLDLDPSDAASVRLRVDSTTTRYAVDIDDLGPVGNAPIQARRYFALKPGDPIVSAWIESTGTTADNRLECPITRPYDAAAPAPIDPRVIHETSVATIALRDSFSTKTAVVRAKAFGAAQPQTCAAPYAASRALVPVQPAPPPAATAVHANGVAIVRVDLDETSAVVRAQIVRSTGFAPLDAAALGAAQTATYRTETFACRPVASSYQYSITFAGD